MVQLSDQYLFDPGGRRMRSASKGIPVLGFACFLLATALPVYPQTTTGRILGEIHDQTGAAVAGATITVTDVQRATKRTVKTDDSGAYAIPSLTPSIYTVRAEAGGFKAVERPSVQVEVA